MVFGLLSACSQANFTSSNSGDASSLSDVEPPLASEIDTDEEKEEVAQKYGCPDPDSVKKVKVCHIPPGNPAAQHTICVSVNALPALTGVLPTPLRDYLGDCKPSAPPAPPAPSPTPNVDDI